MERIEPFREYLSKQPRIALAGMLEGYLVSELVCSVRRDVPREEQIAEIDRAVGVMRAEVEKWKPLARMVSRGRRLDRLLAELDRADRGLPPMRRKRRKARRST